jgi:hypothetical protein
VAVASLTEARLSAIKQGKCFRRSEPIFTTDVDSQDICPIHNRCVHDSQSSCPASLVLERRLVMAADLVDARLSG